MSIRFRWPRFSWDGWRLDPVLLRRPGSLRRLRTVLAEVFEELAFSLGQECLTLTQRLSFGVFKPGEIADAEPAVPGWRVSVDEVGC